MRILHFYKTFFPNTTGGVEQMIHQLAQGMVRQGVGVDVLSLSRQSGQQSTLTEGGYTSHTMSQNFEVASMGCSIAVFRRFAELAKQADLIHYHFPWPWMDLVHFATRHNKPTLVTYHSDIVRQRYALKLYTPLMRRFLTSVDRIVATSPNYCKTSTVLQEFASKTTAIPLGLERTAYAPASVARLNAWRERFPNPFFLFVGVLRYYKGLHVLLEALRGTDYPVLIVGSGPNEAALQKQAVEAGLHHVVFLGALPEEDKIALLTLCYAILFPSHLRSEAFGLALLEGAMFGKPMISCEMGTGTSFINKHGYTGLTVPPNDPLALKKAIAFLWAHVDEAALMGSHAEDRYWELFTAEKMTNAYLTEYNKLLER